MKPSDFQEYHVDEENTVTILSGQTVSNVQDCGGTQLCALYVPTSLANATLTFLATNAAGQPLGLLYDGASPTPNPVSYLISGDVSNPYTCTFIPPIIFAGVKYFRIVSDTAPASDAEIILGLRPT